MGPLIVLDQPAPTPVEQEKKQEIKPAVQQKKAEPGVAGLRRGFLNAGPAPAKAKKDAVLHIKAAPASAAGAGTSDRFVFDDVQEAMRAVSGVDPKAFMTPDLFSEIDRNADLRATFNDPEFGRFLAEMQADPRTAMRRYAGHPCSQQFMAAMQQTTGLMGAQLEKHDDNYGKKKPAPTQSPPPQQQQPARPKIEELSDDDDDVVAAKQQQQSKTPEITPVQTRRIAPPAPAAPLPAHEQAIVDRVQRDPRVREVLADPDVQRFLALGRDHPERIPVLLRTMGPGFMGKLKVLADVGLVNMEFGGR
ncbi:hypothetical protein H9P43_009941 [Blastocladiella emersonii ATCC 22665]|nr:hypothetical protein H9P43_009941 [Blastocladiella emersonii ATCC 22665]